MKELDGKIKDIINKEGNAFHDRDMRTIVEEYIYLRKAVRATINSPQSHIDGHLLMMAFEHTLGWISENYKL